MNIIDLIQKKASNKILTNDEIKFIIDGFVNKDIKDYQMSSFLMAVKINGMNMDEIVALTNHMMNSGNIIDLSEIKGIKVDKHSTGGVGDKTTIAVAPIVASCGGILAKMSGRALGHTGGTLDKLESIPGFKVELSEKEFIKQVQKINIAVISQTKKIVPADKLMYALRDVTGTINSIPLIISSIMSKKIATGSDAILLDIKCGNGAFIQNKKDAKTFSDLIIQLGQKFNKDVKTIISDMNKPLGNSIGNKNEVLEAINTLKGNGPKDFTNLVYKISSEILIQAKIAKTIIEAEKLVKESIKSNKAFETFKIWIKTQGGNIEYLLSDNFWNPKYKYEVLAKKNGVLEILSTIKIGQLTSKLGAGRKTKIDKIDYDAGIILNKKNSDKIQKGDLLITLYSSTKIKNQIILEIQKTFKIN